MLSRPLIEPESLRITLQEKHANTARCFSEILQRLWGQTKGRGMGPDTKEMPDYQHQVFSATPSITCKTQDFSIIGRKVSGVLARPCRSVCYERYYTPALPQQPPPSPHIPPATPFQTFELSRRSRNSSLSENLGRRTNP